MGSGASSTVATHKYLHVRHGNRVAKVRIDSLCCRKEIQEAIALSVGLERNAEFVLRDPRGNVTLCNAVLAPNPIGEPYEITEVQVPNSTTDCNAVVEAAELLGSQLRKVLNFEEFQRDVDKKILCLEKRLDRESQKVQQLEKLKQTVKELQENSNSTSKYVVDFSRLRPSISSQDVLYAPMVHSSLQSLRTRRDTVWDFTKYRLSEETIAYLKKPTFDIWQWDHNEMVVLLEHMYDELGLIEELHISPTTLRRWLLVVQENYRNNPFHNFRHCFCVSQMMYGLIHECKLMAIFSRRELAILITSAICHDLDHPGFNNTYQINARTELAIRYNDSSPLENHHCAVAFQILSNPEWNIFSNLSDQEFKEIRQGMIELILATDMAHHGSILENFRSIVDTFDPNKAEHLTSLKKVLIKSCDISNEVRPMDVSGPWVDCLLEEYFQQAEKERQEGLPVAPFMDKNKVTKASAQLGFIQYVLLPLFEAVAKLFPQLESLMVTPLREALDFYKNLKEEEETSR